MNRSQNDSRIILYQSSIFCPFPIFISAFLFFKTFFTLSNHFDENKEQKVSIQRLVTDHFSPFFHFFHLWRRPDKEMCFDLCLESSHSLSKLCSIIVTVNGKRNEMKRSNSWSSSRTKTGQRAKLSMKCAVKPFNVSNTEE